MMESIWLVPVIILAVNIVYVSLNTMRMILTMKGQRYLAAFVSLFEIVMYVIGLGLVLNRLDAVQNIAAYAVGFALGIIVGMKIEEKLALGYITINVISGDFTKDLPNLIREYGYGVTDWVTQGREGARLKMEILTPRKYERNLYQRVQELDPSAFLVSHEPKNFYGGFWVKTVRKRFRRAVSQNNEQ